MSIAPVMIACNICRGKGTVLLHMPLNHCQNYFSIEDICEKCGGSGRIVYNGNF